MNEHLKQAIELLEQRIAEITQKIGSIAVDGDLDKVTAVSSQAQELKASLKILADTQRRIASAERKLAEQFKTHTKGAPTSLWIQIIWQKLGINQTDETICERKATDSMQRLLIRLEQEFGVGILEKGGELIYGKRPILSRHPEHEWVNPKTGDPYAAKPIGSTGWHVLTHTSTEQKVEHIEALRSYLALPMYSITARAIPRG